MSNGRPAIGGVVAGPALHPPLTGVSDDINTAGVTGNNLAGGVGVFGTGRIGIKAQGARLAGRFEGNVEVLGDVSVTGTLHAGIGIFRGVLDFFAHRIFAKAIVNNALPAVLTPDSAIMVSLTELDVDGNPFLGAVTMKVYNVVPGYNKVEIRGEIDTDDDLHIRATLLIANLPPLP